LEQILGRILLLNIAIYLSNIKISNFLQKKYAHKIFNSQKIIVTDTIKNAKKRSFSKLFSGFHFWTFLKMSKIHFPFDFMGKSCDCDGEL
jgi:hypothetical protein